MLANPVLFTMAGLAAEPDWACLLVLPFLGVLLALFGAAFLPLLADLALEALLAAGLTICYFLTNLQSLP